MTCLCLCVFSTLRSCSIVFWTHPSASAFNSMASTWSWGPSRFLLQCTLTQSPLFYNHNHIQLYLQARDFKIFYFPLPPLLSRKMESGGPESASPMTHRVQSLSSADTRGKHRIHAELKRLEQEARFLEVRTLFFLLFKIFIIYILGFCSLVGWWFFSVCFLLFSVCVVFSIGLLLCFLIGLLFFFLVLLNERW